MYSVRSHVPGQIGKEKIKLYRSLEKLGVNAASAELYIENLKEQQGSDGSSPKWARCTKDNFQAEEVTKLNELLNEGVRSEYMPDYAAPNGIHKNVIKQSSNGRTTGGGASEMVKRSKLLQAAGIHQGGDGWPSTSNTDTGLGQFCDRYRVCARSEVG